VKEHVNCPLALFGPDTGTLRGLLESAGFKGQLVSVNTIDGLKRALRRGVTLVVALDAAPPAIDLVDVAATLRDKEAPLVVVSTGRGEARAVELMRAGASDVVQQTDVARLLPVLARVSEASAAQATRARELRLLSQARSLVRTAGFEIDLRRDSVMWSEELHRLHVSRAQEYQPPADFLLHVAAPRYQSAMREALHRAFRFFDPIHERFEWVTASGVRRWVRLVANVTVESGVAVRLVGAVEDISTERATQTQVLLADRLSVLGTMAAAVAHEVATPLAFVSGSLPAVLHHVRGSEAEDTVRDCLAGIHRIADVVKDLKSLSRVDDGPLQAVDLHKVVQSVVRLTRAHVEKRVSLQLELHEVPPVLGLESRLAQVVTNLLLNAVQAMPAGRDKARNRVTLRVERRGHDVVFEVEDTGEGIAPEVLPRIFEPFFTTKAQREGTGLGLAIVQSLVSESRGSVSVSSKVDTGTTFVVRLTEASRTVSPIPAAAPKQHRLLVIDDEPRLGKAVARMLPQYEVVVAGSAASALAMLESGQSFDALLCDLMMPTMSGIELFDVLQARQPDLANRCIFMSGGVYTAEVRLFAEKLPAGRMVEKPFESKSIERALRGVVGPR
jgi:signal transduction histidine kinase